MQIFLTSWRRHVGRVWMSRFRRVWMSLNFYKEYLFGFETLVFATLRIYAQTACNTPKRKENLKLHHMTPLKLKLQTASFKQSALNGFLILYMVNFLSNVCFGQNSTKWSNALLISRQTLITECRCADYQTRSSTVRFFCLFSPYAFWYYFHN